MSEYFLDAHNTGVVRAIQFILYSKGKISLVFSFLSIDSLEFMIPRDSFIHFQGRGFLRETFVLVLKLRN
jgi:hypothetical protein